MLIAHLTDPHVTRPGRLASGRVDTARMLEAAVASVRALPVPPDLVVLTGDLVDAGHPDEYARLQELLSPLSQPLLCVPGNHDERAAFRAAFPLPAASGPAGFLQFIHETPALRLIGLDTVVPGEPRGELCATRLAWLAQVLADAPQRPTVVLMHHPPFKTGIAFMDAMGLTGRETFAALVAQHPQVKLLLCGHLHRPIHTLVGGRPTFTAPSTAHQIPLDLRAEAPEGFTMEPPGFMLHQWTGQGFVTHTVPVGPWPGPFPF